MSFSTRGILIFSIFLTACTLSPVQQEQNGAHRSIAATGKGGNDTRENDASEVSEELLRQYIKRSWYSIPFAFRWLENWYFTYKEAREKSDIFKLREAYCISPEEYPDLPQYRKNEACANYYMYQIMNIVFENNIGNTKSHIFNKYKELRFPVILGPNDGPCWHRLDHLGSVPVERSATSYYLFQNENGQWVEENDRMCFSIDMFQKTTSALDTDIKIFSSMIHEMAHVVGLSGSQEHEAWAKHIDTFYGINLRGVSAPLKMTNRVSYLMNNQLTTHDGGGLLETALTATNQTTQILELFNDKENDELCNQLLDRRPKPSSTSWFNRLRNIFSLKRKKNDNSYKSTLQYYLQDVLFNDELSFSLDTPFRSVESPIDFSFRRLHHSEGPLLPMPREYYYHIAYAVFQASLSKLYCLGFQEDEKLHNFNELINSLFEGKGNRISLIEDSTWTQIVTAVQSDKSDLPNLMNVFLAFKYPLQRLENGREYSYGVFTPPEGLSSKEFILEKPRLSDKEGLHRALERATKNIKMLSNYWEMMYLELRNIYTPKEQMKIELSEESAQSKFLRIFRGKTDSYSRAYPLDGYYVRNFDSSYAETCPSREGLCRSHWPECFAIYKTTQAHPLDYLSLKCYEEP